MKKTLSRLMLLALSLTLSLTPSLAEPSAALQGVYDALIAEDSYFSQTKAVYDQYYADVSIEASLSDTAITLTLNSTNEYVQPGSWTFTEDGDALTMVLSNQDIYGAGMTQYIINAAADALGVNTALYNGYLSALALTDQEGPYMTQVIDEEAGTVTIRVNIVGPYEMEGLDEMVLTEEILKDQGYEPLGENGTGRVINFGKVTMVVNGSADSADFLVMEYGALDQLACDAAVAAVKTLQPQGWEAFLSAFTAWENLEGDGFSVLAPADEATVSEIIEENLEGYVCAVIRFGQMEEE